MLRIKDSTGKYAISNLSNTNVVEPDSIRLISKLKKP
jgi:hypothetical protein